MTFNEMSTVIEQAKDEITRLRARNEKLEIEIGLYRKGILRPVADQAEYQKDWREDREGDHR